MQAGLAWWRATEEGVRLQYTYFPQSAVVSLIRTLRGGRVVETARFGREGLVGLAFGSIPLRLFGRYIVQITGTALRIDTASLHRAAEARPAIWSMILRYTEILTSLTQRSAACNAVHNVEARAGRWIIATCDRVNRKNIPLTHEFLADMLGFQCSTGRHDPARLPDQRPHSAGTGKHHRRGPPSSGASGM